MVKRIGSWVVVVLCWVAAPATAQVRPEAETLFRDSKTLMQQGQIAEACELFEASETAEHNVATVLSLADCRDRNHQYATAWTLFLQAYSQTRTDASKAALNRTAKARAAVLELKLSYLTVSVSDESRVEGLSLSRNGKPFEAALWNRALPVDGGDFVIEGPDCRSALACGNAFVDPGEECDLGISVNGDHSDCRASCVSNRCGDGYVDIMGPAHHEDCDDALPAPEGSRNATPVETATCNLDCTTPQCGDGKVNAHFVPPGASNPEQCDNGSANNDSAGCTSHCQINICGDGLVFAGVEACDDGNPTCGSCAADCSHAVMGHDCVSGQRCTSNADCSSGVCTAARTCR
jgi:hypothetical protein